MFIELSRSKFAQVLGVSKYVGSLAYDFVDLGILVHGKLKLEPKLDKTLKINEFNPVNKEVLNYIIMVFRICKEHSKG